MKVVNGTLTHRWISAGVIKRHMYQLLQVSILFFVYRYILLPISIGKLYHWIRGQAMIKLYVLIAIVEVFDRLMCSLGQDCLDSLYWNTTRRPRSSRMLISVSVVMFYTAVHSLILFVHVATLNVAMNSADEALRKSVTDNGKARFSHQAREFPDLLFTCCSCVAHSWQFCGDQVNCLQEVQQSQSLQNCRQ